MQNTINQAVAEQTNVGAFLSQSNNLEDRPIAEVIPFTSADTSNAAALPSEPERLKSVFKLNVDAIKSYGKTLPERIEGFARNAVIHDLGEIVGVLHKFFVGASDEQVTTLKNELWKEVDINYNVNTSECHLLSRVYRGSNRRKASADAKVLKAAIADGITQAAFPDWVKSNGGYDAIVKSNSKNSTKEPSEPKKPDAKALWGWASESINAMIENGQMSDPFSFDESDWPELCKKLSPDFENGCSVVLVNRTGGVIHFRKLEDFEPFTPAYEHKHFDGVRVQHVVNVDGTSADTWPEAIVPKSGSTKKSSDEPESTVKAPA
jgi:hypothetical protein